MIRYIALLRGINLGSHHRIAMPELQAAFEAAGFSEVSTYVQSGNVVFEAAASPKLVDQIQDLIKSKFGHEVIVIIRTVAEMQSIAKNNPFLADSRVDLARLYVTFLAEPPASDKLSNIDSKLGGADQWRVQGREVYLYCPGGYGRSKLSNDLFERKLGVAATTRNWKTVTALAQAAKG